MAGVKCSYERKRSRLTDPSSATAGRKARGQGQTPTRRSLERVVRPAPWECWTTQGPASHRRGNEGRCRRKRRPGTVDGRSGTVDGRPGTADGRPATADGRPGTADGRPGTADGRPGRTDGRPGTTDDARERRMDVRQRQTDVRERPPRDGKDSGPNGTKLSDGPRRRKEEKAERPRAVRWSAWLGSRLQSDGRRRLPPAGE